MDRREVIIKDLKDKVHTTGSQVKQKIKHIQMELLEELNNDSDKRVDL